MQVVVEIDAFLSGFVGICAGCLQPIVGAYVALVVDGGVTGHNKYRHPECARGAPEDQQA